MTSLCGLWAGSSCCSQSGRPYISLNVLFSSLWCQFHDDRILFYFFILFFAYLCIPRVWKHAWQNYQWSMIISWKRLKEYTSSQSSIQLRQFNQSEKRLGLPIGFTPKHSNPFLPPWAQREQSRTWRGSPHSQPLYNKHLLFRNLCHTAWI